MSDSITELLTKIIDILNSDVNIDEESKNIDNKKSDDSIIIPDEVTNPVNFQTGKIVNIYGNVTINIGNIYIDKRDGNHIVRSGKRPFNETNHDDYEPSHQTYDNNRDKEIEDARMRFFKANTF